MTTKGRVEYPVSAGGVVYKTRNDEVSFVICGQDSSNGWVWGLPKGTPDPGETIENTAIREVTEETGLKVIVEEYIDSTSYWFVRLDDGVKCHKTVHFYLMSPVGGSFEDHDHEFDDVRWFDAQESRNTMTHENEIRVLEKAIEMVAQKSEDSK